MPKNQFLIDIGALWQSAKGTTEKLQLEGEIPVDDNKPHFDGNFLLIKLKDSIVVIIKQMEVSLKLTCNKCLTQYSDQIKVKEVEREFFYQKPPHDFDSNEHFLINKKDLTIDLTEMLRQEIILHFPINTVCSDRCKGLCSGCGINLNKTRKHRKNCSGNIDKTTPHQQKPFANLKNLINN